MVKSVYNKHCLTESKNLIKIPYHVEIISRKWLKTEWFSKKENELSELVKVKKKKNVTFKVKLK